MVATMLAACPVAAQWQANGAPLFCNSPDDQTYPAIVSDGAGGAIIAWKDRRGGTTYGVYAQRLSADGVRQWTADGVALGTAGGLDGTKPAVVSDGAGGAIVAWSDDRSGGDIYAQRVSSDGLPQWMANGLAVSTASGRQQSPAICSDGAEGAIIAWQDAPIAGGAYVYSQRVNAYGIPQWKMDGVPVSSLNGPLFCSRNLPAIAPDGTGGAIVVWMNACGPRIYAQRLDADGVRHWNLDGTQYPFEAGIELGLGSTPSIVSDGAQGAIVAWDHGVRAQRVDGSGVTQWQANGVDLCPASGLVFNPSIVSDGIGGAIAAWTDDREGNRVYAQRVNSVGVIQWTADGVRLGASNPNQWYPAICSDEAGGAIVVWQDYQGSNGDEIYAQRVSPDGVIQWATGGVVLCTAQGNQELPAIVPDGAGGAIVAWEDARSGTWNIYAQRVPASGVVGCPAGQTLPDCRVAGSSTLLFGPRYSIDADCSPDPLGTAVFYDSTRVHVTRSAGDRFFISGSETDNSEWICDDRLYVEDSNSGPVGFAAIRDGSFPLCQPIGEVLAPVPAREVTDLIPEGTNCVTFRLADTQRQILGNTAIYLLKTSILGVGSPLLGGNLELLPPTPNPMRTSTTIAAELQSRTRLRVRIVDLQGRVVRTLADEEAGPGKWSTTWDGRSHSSVLVRPGIYLVQLAAGSRSLTRRLAILK